MEVVEQLAEPRRLGHAYLVVTDEHGQDQDSLSRFDPGRPRLRGASNRSRTGRHLGAECVQSMWQRGFTFRRKQPERYRFVEFTALLTTPQSEASQTGHEHSNVLYVIAELCGWDFEYRNAYCSSPRQKLLGLPNFLESSLATKPDR